jgi:hypothetical protein
MNALTKTCVWPLVASLALAGIPQAALAGLIGTEAVAATEQALRPAAEARTQLAQTLARADVAAGLQARGVDPAEVLARVHALTDAEAQALAAQIDSAPAGASDILGTIVFIFVLLLVTDILGLTKVFPFTRSVR